MKLVVDKFCEKLPSFMSSRILVWIEIYLAVGTPLAKQEQQQQPKTEPSLG